MCTITSSIFEKILGESFREYFTLFNEMTIKGYHPNRKMFVGAFINVLRARNFNESMSHMPTSFLEDVETHVELYLKGKKICQKKSRDVKDYTFGNFDNTQQSRKNHYTLPFRDRETFKGNKKPT